MPWVDSAFLTCASCSRYDVGTLSTLVSSHFVIRFFRLACHCLLSHHQVYSNLIICSVCPCGQHEFLTLAMKVQAKGEPVARGV